MSWHCDSCDEDHPGRFDFCPVTGTRRPQIDTDPPDPNTSSSPDSAPSLVVFERPPEGTSNTVVSFLERALVAAREGRVSFIAMAYGLHDTPSPNMHYWVRHNVYDAMAAISCCFGLAQMIALKNFDHQGCP
jgi:hypothetical protein